MRNRLLPALLLAVSLAGCDLPLEGAVDPASVIPPNGQPGVIPPVGGGQPVTTAGMAQGSLRAKQSAGIALALGQEKPLMAEVVDQTNQSPTSGVIWASSDERVVTVNPTSGVAKATGNGSAVVTASLQSNPAVKTQLTVTVTEQLVVKDIKVTPQTSKVAKGDTVSLQAVVAMADGTINANVTWKSSDDSVATVSDKGVVKARQDGQVTIEAVYAGDTRFKGIAIITIGDYKPTPAPTAQAEPGEDTGTPIVPSKPLGTWVAQEATGTYGQAVYMLDDKTGWLSNNDGIARTTDGGKTWPVVAPAAEASNVLEFASFADGTGLAMSSYGYWRTTDGGATWTKGTLEVENQYVLGHINVVGAAEAYLTVSDMNAYTYYGNVVFHTTDAGATWKRETLAMQQVQIAQIVAVGGDKLALTHKGLFRNSGGEEWTKQEGTTLEGGYQQRARAGALAVRGGTVWYAGASGFLRSKDGGKNWTNLGRFNGVEAIAGMAASQALAFGMTDDDHGYFVSTTGIIVTADGGKNWRGWPDMVVGYGGAYYTTAHFPDNDHGWLLDTKGVVRRLSN